MNASGNISAVDGLLGEVKWMEHLEGLMTLFFIVRPSKTMHRNLEDAPELLEDVIKYVPILMIIEACLMWHQSRKTYRWNDCITAAASFGLIALPRLISRNIEFRFFTYIYENYRLVDVPINSYLTWFICILVTDFQFYVVHRLNHEVNFMWSFHEAHHMSEDFNVFAGLRLTVFNRYVLAVADLPWAFIFPPGMFFVHHQINFIYQFWIHTETVPSLGPLEYIMNTPSLHAIHHGRNRSCIDKNYGGLTSIFDQLFGTIEWPKKERKIYFGLVHPVDSWDVYYTQLRFAKEFIKKINSMEGLGNKLSVFFKGPGWQPGTPRLGAIEDIPEIPEVPESYNKESPQWIYFYAAFNVALIYVFFVSVMNAYTLFEFGERMLLVIYQAWGVGNAGFLLEHKWYFPLSECLRCAVFFFYEMVMVSRMGQLGTLYTVLKYWFPACALFWTFNMRMFSKEYKYVKKD